MRVWCGLMIASSLALLAAGCGQPEFAEGMRSYALTCNAANGYPVMSLGNGPDLRAAAGSVLYLALIALLALGVTTAVRDSAVGTGLVLGLLYLFPIASAVVPDHTLSRHLEQAAPMTAGLWIQATAGVRSLPLTPWQGLGVLALWTLGALILGAAVLRLRDA